MSDTTDGSPFGFEAAPLTYDAMSEQPTQRRDYSVGVVIALFATVLLNLIAGIAAYSAADFYSFGGGDLRDNVRVTLGLFAAATVVALVAVVLLSARTPISAALAVIAGALASTGLMWSVFQQWSDFVQNTPFAAKLAVFAQNSVPLVLGLLALALWRRKVT